MAKKRAKIEEPKKNVKSEEPKKKKPISLNILEIAKRLQKLEEAGGGGGSADSAKRSDIATEFSAETSYTAGNFVYYEGKLYQFNADHSAGAWDPTDVVEANVTDQIVSNASAIAGLTASDVAYDNTDSGLTATNTQGAIDEVITKLGNMKISKLWENSDPTVNFIAQTIELSSDNYDILLLIGKVVTSLNREISSIIIKGSGASLIGFSGSGLVSAIRSIDYTDDTHFYVTSGTIQSGGSTVTDDSRLIPVAIYGIKIV